METWIILLVVAVVLLTVGVFLFRFLSNQKIKDSVNNIANQEEEITVEEFFKIRNKKLFYDGNKKYALSHDFQGIYILFNKSKNMYYVGQSINIFKRVNQHFTGKGNGDVYADYKYGDIFTIKLLNLENSNFNSLNELENKTIYTYKSKYKLYNKTRGNKY
ncbi:MAG: GIY-YIG nuclease family protein [Mycoplasmoidaceae bacterium]